MIQTTANLSKRTKQEILDEYEKLQEQLDDLRSTAQTIKSQPVAELMEKMKVNTPQTIDKSFGDFQTSIYTQLTNLRTALLDQSATLQDFQKAVELSRQQLELQHQITVAADTLDILVDEHTKKTILFETDMEKRKHELEEQIVMRKKSWERETEEYEYKKKLKHEHDQTETEEREKALLARESSIRTQEQENVQMKKTIEQFPQELEQAIEKHELGVTARLTQDFAHEKALLEKGASAQISLLELTVKNLEDRLVSQEREFISLKQQAEDANAKAQALAIKAIERPTTIVAPTNSSPTNTSSFHGNGQERTNR